MDSDRLHGAIKAIIERTVEALAPEVAWIRYEIRELRAGLPGSGLIGETGICFRIMLSYREPTPRDLPETLRRTIRRVQANLINRLDRDEIGLYPYFNYRTLYEHETLKLTDSDLWEHPVAPDPATC
jgi:hypothetical protein